MPSTLALAPLLMAALAAAAVVWLGMAVVLHRTGRVQHGYLHWVMPALLLIMAAGVWLSGRDLTSHFLGPEFTPDPPRPPLLDVLQPVLSLLLLAISAERILTHWLLRPRQAVAPLLPLSFGLFWLGTIASPGVFGAHPHWSHNLLYPLVIGLAATLADRREQDLALRATGHALLLMMFVGLLLIPILPTLVLDRQYAQGWLPGLPRFGGLATHPVSMGLLAQLGLLCLLARPLPKVWLNRAAWLMGLTVLFMAQSKTAWVAFVLCTAAVLVVRGWPHWQAQLGRVQQPTPALLVLGLALLGIAGALLLLVLGDPGGRLERFLLSPEGSQLSAMTGRDRIWAIAWQEWQSHSWFGWGLPIWDDAYRRAIGMSHATHAHNQLMDTLSRSGLVGAAALLGYTVVLGVLALRHARATQGLSVALLLALLLRAGSEVPLLLMGYGPDLIAHLLLLMTLAAQSADRAAEPSRPRSAGAAAPPAPHGHAGLGAATGRWLSATGPRRP